MKYAPPRWADRFLEWYCNPALLEEIQGDAHELYERQIKRSGKRKADFHFAWNVLRFFRWSNIKQQKNNYSTNSTAMFKNFLLMGFRSSMRNGITSLINILGLSIGVGAAITIFIFTDHQYNTDNFHRNFDRIYQVTNQIKVDDRLEDWSDSPILLGPSMKQDIDAVEDAARVEFTNAALRYDDIVFNEFVWFVDGSFSTIFSFPVVEGAMSALKDKTKIAITTETAKKFFGNDPAFGQPLSVKFQNEEKREFTVGAVIDRPAQSSMFFSILLPMEVFDDLKFKDSYDWSYLTDATFILLREGRSVAEVQGHMEEYKSRQNASLPQWVVEDFVFHPLNGLSRKGHDIISSVTGGAHPQGIYALSTIAALLLLLSCFNYMNISVATITTRLKEIGIRKVVGSDKKRIVLQFLTENLLMTVVALAAGALVAYLFFLPGLSTLFPIDIPFAFSSGSTLFILFFGLLFFISLVSGVYPAIYVSAFQPVQILAGKEKFGQRSIFSRILLTAQFVLAFMLIVGCFVFIDNAMYLRDRDWGYEYANNYVMPVVKAEQYLALRDKAASLSNVDVYAGARNHVGYTNPRIAINHLDTRLQVVNYKVGVGYLETMNLQLTNGRYFDEAIATDFENGVVINEVFASRMNWANPLQESFEADSVKRNVIGVIRNFHYDSFYEPIQPVMFTLVKEDQFLVIAIKAKPGEVDQVETSMKQAWKEIAPDDPYEGFVQEKVGDEFNNDNNANMKLLWFISGMALTLSCLGLFGLVSYNITRRKKEFSIRKVFGASTVTIFKLMNRDYTWILGVSFLLGAPAGFLLMNNLIQHIYPDPQSAGPFPFIVAVLAMVITVGITIGSQMHRIVKENPSNTLRND